MFGPGRLPAQARAGSTPGMRVSNMSIIRSLKTEVIRPLYYDSSKRVCNDEMTVAFFEVEIQIEHYFLFETCMKIRTPIHFTHHYTTRLYTQVRQTLFVVVM